MILITGAAGKTGMAILSALVRKKAEVRAFVRSEAQMKLIRQMGIEDVIIGDIQNPKDISKAVTDIDSIYFICPNVSPSEFLIGKQLIDHAKQSGVKRFVYHSVLHPQIKSMPHHWQKMQVEEQVFSSGMEFVILQPCAYMQNILGSLNQILNDGIYPVPYNTNTQISLVDLVDVADAASRVLLTSKRYNNAIYELSGPEPLSQIQVASILSESLGKSIVCIEENKDYWISKAINNGVKDYALNTLLSMFDYYNKYGFVGNSFVLQELLGRKPNDLSGFIRNQILPVIKEL